MPIRNVKDVSKSTTCKRCFKEFFFGFREYSVCQECLKSVFDELGTIAKEREVKLKIEKNEKKRQELKREKELAYSKHYKLREHLNDQSFRPIEPAEQINRVCLKCDKKFVANGRFNRLCVTCREQNFNIRRSITSDILE